MQETTSERESINRQLRDLIIAHTPQPGSHTTAVPGLHLIRRVRSGEMCLLLTPFIGLTVQGTKRTVVGKEEILYGKDHCCVLCMDMPGESHVTGASEAEPFLSLAVDLDRSLVARLAAEIPASACRASGNSTAVMEADEKVMDAFLRLAQLLDEPPDIPVMAPMLMREIHYRLLLGPQGPWLRSVCAMGTASSQVAQAAEWLRENFRAPFHVEDLARMVGMSPSSFFRNFKKMTTFSPLQFQKMLRLYEAQRLLLVDSCDVANAAYAVGYESSTQFIREYKRMFGDPPRRDIVRRRQMAFQ